MSQELEKKHYDHFQNQECEYFPCHSCTQEQRASFNCLFCYCPLYCLGARCGGHYEYLPNGIKSCEHCMIPHNSGGYDYIMSKMGQVMEKGKQIDNNKSV